MLYNNIDRGPGKNNICSCLAAYGPHGPLGPMALWAPWPFGPYGPLDPAALWTHTRAGRRMMNTREDEYYREDDAY